MHDIIEIMGCGGIMVALIIVCITVCSVAASLARCFTKEPSEGGFSIGFEDKEKGDA